MNLCHPTDTTKIISVKEGSSKYHKLMEQGYIHTGRHSAEHFKIKSLNRKNLIASTQTSIDALNQSLKELHLTPNQHHQLLTSINILNNQIKRLSS